MPELNFQILPKTQLQVWKKLQLEARPLEMLNYYLAGGTALALQLGHRQSVDFDFFSRRPAIATRTLDCFERFPGAVIRDRDAHTLHGEVDGVKVSFIANYRYPFLKKPIRAGLIKIASIFDIALMKLLAITHRATLRDYVDLAAIIRSGVSFETLLQGTRKKYGKQFNPMICVKALIYHGDIDMEMPKVFDRDLKQNWKKILSKAVKEVA